MSGDWLEVTVAFWIGFVGGSLASIGYVVWRYAFTRGHADRLDARARQVIRDGLKRRGRR